MADKNKKQQIFTKEGPGWKIILTLDYDANPYVAGKEIMDFGNAVMCCAKGPSEAMN